VCSTIPSRPSSVTTPSPSRDSPKIVTGKSHVPTAALRHNRVACTILVARRPAAYPRTLPPRIASLRIHLNTIANCYPSPQQHPTNCYNNALQQTGVSLGPARNQAAVAVACCATTPAQASSCPAVDLGFGSLSITHSKMQFPVECSTRQIDPAVAKKKLRGAAPGSTNSSSPVAGRGSSLVAAGTVPAYTMPS
jgi:hypothetical protein